MNKSDAGATVSYMVLPVSNIIETGGSVLPKRFVGRSESQNGSIVGDDLGSTSMPKFQSVTIVMPNNITA